MAWWTALLSVAGSAAANNAANESAQNITDAQIGASEDQLALAQAIYADQRGLQMPTYLQGQEARNTLGALYGLAPTTYTGANAFGGAPSFAGSANGKGPDGSLPTKASSDHTGYTNAMALFGGDLSSTADNPDWWAEGGPDLMAAVWSKLFGVKGRGDGGSAVDQWGTQDENYAKAQGFDGDAYLTANPDVERWFNTLSDRDTRYLLTSYDINKDGKLDRNEAGAGHYYGVGGQKEGRAVPTAAATGATGTTGTTGATGGAPSAAVDPMQRFYNSPDAKLAQNQFLNFDVPELQSAFAVGGKALSGAQQGALAQQGAGRLGNAFGDYKAGLGTLAGYGQAAGSQVGSYAAQYGNAAGNAFGNIGTANANNALMRGQNQQAMYNGIGRAFGSQGWT